MLAIDPDGLRFGSTTWTRVRFVSVDRFADRLIEGYRDGGPYAVFADVARQRVVVRATLEVGPDDPEPPAPGEMGTLRFDRRANASGKGRTRVTMTAVLVGVQHAVTRSGSATRTLEFRAVSSDADTDPVGIIELS